MGHALASACHQGLIREFKLPTQGEAKRFSKALAAWNAASNLNDESFRECFTHGLVDDLATVRRLRQAAAGSVTAQTFGQMVDASRPLTAAIKDIGASRWTGVLGGLQEQAENVMPASSKIMLAAGSRQEELDPREALEPTAGMRCTIYNNLQWVLRQLNPRHPELEYIVGPNWIPSNQAIEALSNAIRDEYRDLRTFLTQLNPANSELTRRPDGYSIPSVGDVEAIQNAIKNEYRKLQSTPQQRGTTSPIITAADLKNKTIGEITEMAKQRGLVLSVMDGEQIIWRDPVTGAERIRIDRGHRDKKGQPFRLLAAAVDHVHGYGPGGRSDPIADPRNGETHFPLNKLRPEWLE